MGMVRKPEDLDKKRELEGFVPDIKPILPAGEPTIKALIAEIKELRAEVEKIKRVLNAHGIKVE